jgi:hypothetical protein
VEAQQQSDGEHNIAMPVAYAISRHENFILPLEDKNEDVLDHLASDMGALVISGGGFGNLTMGSLKRKFEELESVCSLEPVTIAEVKERFAPLAFYKEEVPGGSHNYQIPLHVKARMANFDVKGILVDQGSSCDVMYAGLFKTLQLTEKKLPPYVGADLQGFNGATTKPWGYVDLIVTFGEEEAAKSINIQFLVVDCPSLYNCIIGIPALANLFVVSSTIHLKMKYYTVDGKVATLNGDIAAARRCFEAAAKNMSTLATQKKKNDHKMFAVNAIEGNNHVDLDARITEEELKDENEDPITKKVHRPIPDGEFEITPLGEDPAKGIKIGAGMPELVKRQLEACLKDYVELFAWSAAEIPGIDPEVACHQLTIDHRARVVVQRRRKLL